MKNNILKEKKSSLMGCVVVVGILGYIFYCAFKGVAVDNTSVAALIGLAVTLFGITDSMLGFKKDQ